MDRTVPVATHTDVKVPMLDLRAEVAELRDELDAAVARVLDSGQFIGGPEVEAFEAEVAAFLGVRHAIGLNSGTDALIISLEALGIGPGDEVITTPFSFFATSEAILRVGAKPVFGDIDPVTLNLDPTTIEALVTKQTKAVLPVHLFGLPCDMSALLDIAKRHDLYVLEDCAQAFGARIGAMGGRRAGAVSDLGAFSFYPTKNLGAYGDAGLIATDDDALAERVRSLRNHASSKEDKYLHDGLGHNSRLDAIQAAILRVKLPRVDAWNVARREVARGYVNELERFTGAGLVLPPASPEHVFHQFTLQLPEARRQSFQEALGAAGISCARFYPSPLTHQPRGRRYGRSQVAAAACERAVSVPCFPRLPEAAILGVAEAVARALGRTV